MPVSVRTVSLLLALALAAGMGIGILTLPRAEPAETALGSGAPANPQSSPTDSPDSAEGLTATADRDSVAANEKLTISGRLTPAEDGVRLVVQRLEGGQWQDFPATTTTSNDGGYSLWIQSGRKGVNTYRVARPDNGTASPEVRVTVT
jgi:hypothetical protein